VLGKSQLSLLSSSSAELQFFFGAELQRADISL